jgi:predicted FMN-binding regulatory protein PaiB
MRLSSEQSLELVSVVKETIRNCELIFLLTRQAKNIKTLPHVQKVLILFTGPQKYINLVNQSL